MAEPASMLERLRAALVAELHRQHDDSRHTGLGWLSVDEGADEAQIDGDVQLSPIIRAVLAELRKVSHDARFQAPELRALKTEGDPAAVVEIIDAILAQGGGSDADQIVKLLREAELK